MPTPAENYALSLRAGSGIAGYMLESTKINFIAGSIPGRYVITRVISDESRTSEVLSDEISSQEIFVSRSQESGEVIEPHIYASV